MSEQPTSNPNSAYDWTHVATEYTDWHPDLHPHVERHLAANGIAAASASRTSEAATLTAERPVQPEQIGAEPQAINESLQSANRTLNKISTDPHFHAYCHEHRIDPFDGMGTPAYWAAVNEFTARRVKDLRHKHGDSLQLQALELVAATPDFLYRQDNLTRSSVDRTSRAGTQARTAASRYGDIISGFVAANPQARSNDMILALLNTANATIEHRDLRAASADYLKASVRGVQHENAFGQILAHTGRTYRRGTVTEDLRGSDYVIDGTVGSVLRVDVKASLNRLEQAGSQGAIHRRSDGVFTMYSMTANKEFGDRFFISDEAAMQKAAVVAALLDQAETSPETFS